MFWGIVVKKGKRYAQTVEESFHISMAALQTDEELGQKQIEEGSSKSSGTISLYVEYESSNYLLCTLSLKEAIFQVPLELEFEPGSSVAFFTKGGSKHFSIHLTGYKLESGQNKIRSLTPANVKAPLHMSTPNVKEEKLNLMNHSEFSLGNKKTPQSILISEKKLKVVGQEKKRVSIKEAPPRNEYDDDADTEELRLKVQEIFNGAEIADLDDDDYEDEEDDDDIDDDDIDDSDEVIDIDEDEDDVVQSKSNQLLKMEDDENDEDEDDDEEDGDDDDDSEDDIPTLVATQAKKNKTAVLPLPKNHASTSNPDNTPKANNKGQQGTPIKTPENAKKSGFTTPDQSQKIKTPSSVGHTPMKFLSKGGVMIQEMKPGSGVSVKSGKMLTVAYTGRLKQNNKEFDNSPSFKFRIGKGEVIRGWDVGLEGMKVGGKRRLIIPPSMAYGKKGAPPNIPPNSTLQFDIEVKNVS